MTQKVKAITDLASATNITEARHMICLIAYYRKFFPIFSDMISLLNALTRKNIPFRWIDQCQKNLDYVKQIITTSPILAYPDPDKQCYLFTDSRKHSWSRILVQYDEEMKEHGTKWNIFHPITYQSGTFQGSQKKEYTNEGGLCNLHVILQMVFYLKDVNVMIQCDYAPLHKFTYSVMRNDKVINWSQAMHTVTPYINFEYTKGKKNILGNSLSWLHILGLYEANEPKKEILEYGKSIFN